MTKPQHPTALVVPTVKRVAVQRGGPHSCLRCAGTGWLDQWVRGVLVPWRCPACR